MFSSGTEGPNREPADPGAPGKKAAKRK